MQNSKDIIYVLDFGSQYSHLITRRIRELGVSALLVSPSIDLAKLKDAAGIILSGGPQNLSDSSALRVDKRVYDLGVPILGICYGMQLTAFELGGRVAAGVHREYGSTEVTLSKTRRIFKGLSTKQIAWMSHGDQVTKLPQGFITMASSKNCPIAGMENEKRKIYCIQFHPEVAHTPKGTKMLDNFLLICKAKHTWSMKDFVSKSISEIKEKIGSDKAICALSGGVDSSVAATMVHRAIGKNLTCIYVDTGLMRANETSKLKKIFANHLKMNLRIIYAEKEFLGKLKGITDPEKKRKTIGELFIRIFEREAKKLGKIKYLVQGTLYTDAVTSGVSIGGKHTAVIKSHHNVGGLPEKMDLKLVEPLRELYKDEVRQIGRMLGLHKSITERQPFPGPGLAVRILGEVTKDKADTLRLADAIVCEEIEENIKKGGERIQEYFAVLPNVRSVGVQGDARTYGHPIIVRALTSKELLTVDWAHLSYSVLEKISIRITNEVPSINRVVYDITSKPPGTVEWE